MAAILSFGAVIAMYAIVAQWAARNGQHTETEYLLGTRSYRKIVVAPSAGAASNSRFMAFILP